jgi:hypothetical protein
MKQKTDVQQGTLAPMILKTLDVADRCTATGSRAVLNRAAETCSPSIRDTLYPVRVRLEQEAATASEWGASENNRRARF